MALDYLKNFSGGGGGWARIAKHVYGMEFGSEGTIMAMAAFGDPYAFSGMLEEALIWASDLVSRVPANATALEEHFKRLRDRLRSDQDRSDLAAALQLQTESRVRALVARYLTPDTTSLCLAGGSFLNCQITGKIYDWFPQLQTVFLPPAPYDGGLSIGAAQYSMHVLCREPIWSRSGPAFPFASGRSYSQLEIVAACRSARVTAHDSSDREVVFRLLEGQVGALFSGSAESGRRALGNRSIVADPRRASVKDRINRTIKHRSDFRPFAPMILREHVAEWFECGLNFESPYMAHALRVRPAMAHRIPAVMHQDGTARVQTVDAALTPRLYELISQWRGAADVPILLNTSFNDNEPIVDTPAQALNCLRVTELDFLYFMDEQILCVREQAPT